MCLKRFDFAVANPPFSYKSWSNGVNIANDEYGRFEYGTPPDKNGDYAFLLHILKSLKSTGKAAVILPHGVLFRGNSEERIRRNLIGQGYIKGIIGLPANLFYGTGIPACIIVLDKEGARDRQQLFMVDGSRDFMKDGNKNRLRSQDIHKIVDVFTKEMKIEGYSRLVSLDEVAANEYNLNIPRYIDSSAPEDRHDLGAHLQGGIPNGDIDRLDAYWQVFPTLRAALFTKSDREGYSDCLVQASQIKTTILTHPEFIDFARKSLALFEAWRNDHVPGLKAIAVGDDPKALIHKFSEDLLVRFCKANLLDKYDIYQILMDYWAETMQDDVDILVQDGWKAGAELRPLVVKKGEKLKETPDLVIGKTKYKADLIPPKILIAAYLSAEQEKVDSLQVTLDTITQELDSFIEVHSGDEGALAEAKNDKDKITKASVTARKKEAKSEGAEPEELKILLACLSLFTRETAARKQVKDAQTALDKMVFDHYPKLTEQEVQTLVVDHKWMGYLKTNIKAEIERVTQALAGRVKVLEERYAEPLPELEEQVDALAGKVEEHLKQMGLSW